MTMRHRIRALAAGATIAATLALGSPAAMAQSSDWLWGGETTYGGAGRQTVSFSGAYAPGQIIVSFGDRRLYFITRPGVADSYPIAIPKSEARWEGLTSVSQKRVNPSWTPTPSMVAKNPRLPRWVPGGHPMNPLGVRALYLGSSTYRIHGTDAPWLIGQQVSSGCIRMYNQDVIELYPRVKVGAKVIVTWNTFKSGPLPESAGAPEQSNQTTKRRAPKSASSSYRQSVRSASVSQ